MAKIVKLGVNSAKNYYFERDSIMNENGSKNNLEISGTIAEAFGLNEGDKLEQKEFENLLKGKTADGEVQLVDRLKSSSTGKENAAFDIVLSAPKSVSMLSLTSDTRLQEAHNEAVKETMAYVNDNYSKTYGYDSEGKKTINEGAGLLIATAKHSIARDEIKGVEDPHLHSHNLVMNMTLDTKDKKFKALAANDMLRDANKFQEMYRSSLASKVKELGYEIEKHSSHSSAFDIAGVSRENVLHFSQRHNKIVQNADTIKEKEFVQNSFKKDKSNLTKEELLKDWNKQQVENFGMNFKELKEHCLSIQKNEKMYSSSKHVLETAMHSLTQNEAVIKEEAVLKLSRKLSIGEYTDSQLREELSTIKKTGQSNNENLKLMGYDRQGKGLYTTKHMYDLERDNMKIIKTQVNVKPIMSNKQADKAIKSFNDKQSWNMSNGQTKAVQAMLTNKQQFLIINGDPGVGKTTLMAAYADATSDRKNLEIKILAPTGKAAKEASDASGLKASTIDSFLLQKRSSNSKQKIYIVDETSMLDASKANALLKIAKKEKAQVVFVGDQKQLKSIGSSNFFSDIQPHAKSVNLTEANRFKNNLQKEVARLANNRQLDKVVDLLDKNNKVIQIDVKLLSKESDNLSQEQLKDIKKTELASQASGIISQNYREINAYAADNKQVDKINEKVREELGFSKQEGIKFEAIKAKSSMNKAENRAIAANYTVGDIIQVNKSVKGLKRFSEYEVKDINTQKNQLTIESQITDRKTNATLTHQVTLDARELINASIGEKNESDFVNGEKIVITRNNKNLGISNGDIGFVKSFNKDKSELTAQFDKKEVTINTNEFKNISYSYATSVHKSQGSTVDKSVLVLDSDNELQNKYNLGEVGVTRQKNDLIIITDNKELIKEQLQVEQIKTSTLDENMTSDFKQDSISKEDHIKDISNAVNEKNQENEKISSEVYTR